MSCGRAQKYEKIISEGFHLVAKDVEGIRDTWRLSLSRAETTLFNDISSLEKKIYFISKCIYYSQIKCKDDISWTNSHVEKQTRKL